MSDSRGIDPETGGFDQLFFVKNTDEGFVITEIQPGSN
jgi:hypothetical protein